MKFSKVIIFIFVLLLVISPFLIKFFKGSSELKLKEGQTYEGDTKNNMRHGTGKLYSKYKLILYDGEWVNDKKEGRGKEYYLEGSAIKYDGEWKAGMYNGYGELFYSNGAVKYKGKWNMGKYDIEGTLYYENGNIMYEGGWKNGAKDGEGKEYFEDGKLKFEGKWIDGIFENEKSSTSGNILNLGFIAESNDWIYVNEFKNNVNSLIKLKSDGTEIIKIKDKINPHFMNVIGKWIYYSNINGQIFKTTIDGKETIQIGKTEKNKNGEKGWYLTIKSEWIYFVGADSCIYRMTKDGTNKKKLTSDKTYYFEKTSGKIGVGWILIEGEYIYYVNRKDQYLYKMKLDGSKKEVVLKERMTHANIIDGWIYYISESDFALYKVKVGDTKKKTNKKLTKKVCLNVNNDGKYLYYVQVVDSKTWEICRFNVDDGKVQKVTNKINSVNFCLVSDWVYYLGTSNVVYRVKTNGSDAIAVIS